MGELCWLFAGLALVLAVLAVVGHGLWLFFAALFSAISGQSRSATPPRVGTASPPQNSVACLRCGANLKAGKTDCLRCGLDQRGSLAGELADLQAVTRQLERFRRAKSLPAHVLDELWNVIQARHQWSLGFPETEPAMPLAPLPLPSAAPSSLQLHRPAEAVEATAIEPISSGLDLGSGEEIPSVIPIEKRKDEPAEPARTPPWRRLQLLLENRHELDLTSSERVRLVLWYRQSSDEQLAALPVYTQLKLARLLAAAKLPDEAWRTYHRCLAQYPQHPAFVDAALAAIALGVEIDPAAAKSLLQDLAERPLSPEQEAEVRRLTTLVSVARPESAKGVVVPARPSQTQSVPPQIFSDTPQSPVPTLTPEQAPVAPPRKQWKWNEVLAGFMEQRNILWGELVGGLLIVGGSIALVVSLWHNLKENPYFPFGIFAGITLALFGAGLYTWNHWKLQTTSRGLLAIATLLVPLSFLVMPRMLEEQVNDAVELAIAAVALGVFGWCLYRAGQVLIPEGAVFLPVSILACCIGQLTAVRNLGAEPLGSAILWLGLIPLLGFAASAGGLRHRLRRSADLEPAAAISHLSLLGLGAFAVAVGLGFLVVRSVEPLLALKDLAPLVSVAAIPITLGGLLLHERLSANTTQAGLRAIGTAVMLTGMTVMLVALALAWPLPWALTAVCAVNLTVLLWIAFRHDLPLAHAPAVASLVVGYLTLFHVATPYSSDLAEQLLEHLATMTAALRLVFLGLGLTVAAEALSRWKRPHGSVYAGGAGVIAAAAVTVAGWNGLANPRDAMFVFGLSALGCLVANVRWARPRLTYAGLVLLAGATLWGLRAVVPGEFPLASAVLAGEALLLGIAASILLRSPRSVTQARSASKDDARPLLALRANSVWSAVYGRPCLHVAEGVALLSLGFALWSGWRQPWQPAHLVAGVLLVGLYLLLTIVQRRQITATLAGLVLVGTTLAATEVIAVAQDLPSGREWFGLTSSITAALMALMVLLIHLKTTAKPASDSASPWYALLPSAWREVILTAGILALWYTFTDHAFLNEQLNTVSLLAITCAAWLMVLPYRAVILAWVGSFLFLVCLLHFLNWMTDLAPIRVILLALLLHATVQILLALGLRISRFACVGADAAMGQMRDIGLMHRLFLQPLLLSGMIASFVALVPLLRDQGTMLPRAAYAWWLAALWLAVAWSYRQRWLWGACQLVCIVAVVFGVAAWLEGQSWVAEAGTAGIWDPRSLQAFGIGLALLCGLWGLARITLQKNRVGRELLLPIWPAVDRLLLGFILIVQLGLVDWAILRDVVQELLPRDAASPLELWPAVASETLGSGAWSLLGVLAAVLLLWLWQPAPTQRQTLALLGWPTLAWAVPPLLAANCAGGRAGASGLLWGLAWVFLAASVPLWSRRPLAGFAARLSVPTPTAGNLPRHARIVLLDGLVVPACLLAVVAASLRYFGHDLSGPAADSWFAQLGPVLTLALPLVLIAAVLAGHAVSENSAGYMFSAGQLLALALTGGYALYLLPAHPRFGEGEWVQLLQVAALATAGWAVLWLTARHWLPGRGAQSPGRLAAPLLEAQVSIPAALNFCLLTVGLSFLVTLPEVAQFAPDETWYPVPSAWTVAAGAPLGWAALALTGLALFVWSGRRLSPLGIGSLMLAVIALIGCTVAGTFPAWGFRAVLLGLAAFVSSWAATLAVLAARNKPAAQARKLEGDPRLRFGLIVNAWVGGGGCLLLLLSLEAALVHQDRLFAATIIALDAAAVFWAGWTLRREAYLFAGGLLLSGATSLAVWHFQLYEPFETWWVLLLQLNGIALALLSLGWMMQLPEWTTRPSQTQGVPPRSARMADNSLLTLLVVMSSLTLLVPLGSILTLLLLEPWRPPLDLAEAVARWTGWLQLGVGITAILGFAFRRMSRQRLSFLGTAGLLLVVQLMATVAMVWGSSWPAIHVLTAGLALLGFGIAVGGWMGTGSGAAGPRFGSEEERERFARRLLDWFPAHSSQRWVEAVGIVLVGLAFRFAMVDPARPWWPALAMLLSAALATMLLAWTRRTVYLNSAGGLVALTGLVIWLAWGQVRIDRLFLIATLSMAAASLYGGLLERWQRRSLAFSGWACYVGLHLLGLVLLVGLAADLSGTGLHLGGPLAWAAWGLLALAALWYSLDEAMTDDALAALPAYAAGLLGVLLSLHEPAFAPEALCQIAALSLSVFVFIAALVAGLGPRLAFVWRRMTSVARPESTKGAPSEPDALARECLPSLARRAQSVQPTDSILPAWFLCVQTVLAGLVVALAFWICCTSDTLAQRMNAPESLLMLMAAALVLCRFSVGPTFLSASGMADKNVGPTLEDATHHNGARLGSRVIEALHHGTLILGAMALLTFGWAWLDPDKADVALLRNILLLGVLGLVALLFGPVLRRLLPGSAVWWNAGRNLALLALLAGASWVIVVLGHEFWLYRVALHAQPLPAWAIALVVATLAALIASSIWFAVAPERDPLALSEQWRTKYVYAAEILLVLLFMHVRLNLPWLFGGLLIRYWSFVIMALAFLGVGLAEWFNRLKLKVLAVPLQRTGVFLPLLPLLAFWLQPLGADMAGGQTAGQLAPDFGAYALVWYTASLLYLIVALVNRSGKYVMIAALAGNFGLWALLYHNQDLGFGFFAHPQLWLIPLAAIVLIAEYINRDRLAPAVGQGLRYFGLVVIYLSSTADLFIAGLQDLPMSLALLLLSIVGILAGIQLRIKAFLFTGLVFLVLVIFARIWHAAVDLQQTWVWWAALIVLGAAILTLFAVFEKRRADLLRVLDEFKNWK